MKLYPIFRQLASRSFQAGDTVKLTRTITQLDLDRFSDISGDHNPVHKSSFQNGKPLVHGAFLNSIVSAVIGTRLPGDGTIVVSQNFNFPNKCFVDDPIEISVELTEVRKLLKVKYECQQNGNLVFQGEAKLMMSQTTPN